MEEFISTLLQNYEKGHVSRRQFVQLLAASAATTTFASTAVAAEKRSFKAVGVNHISYNVADYKRTADFYADFLGMVPGKDDGRAISVMFGDTSLRIRNVREKGQKAHIDHLSFQLVDWDKDAVKAEIERRGLKARPDTDYSWHFDDPDGFDVQVNSPQLRDYVNKMQSK
jgi:catechol 2,3-dioxygenase-like lactoylglutathione lyase family enzyme